MKLVEAEEPAKLDDVETPIVTPPRPPHRRVSVSLLFTLTVLIGTVVTIYLVFPARDNVLLTEALASHRDPKPTWELVEPPANELRAWTIGLIGADVPPIKATRTLGAARTTIFDRNAAIMRVEIDGAIVTVLLQHARGIGPTEDRTFGDLRGIERRAGKYTFAVVGPSATFKTWSSMFR